MLAPKLRSRPTYFSPLVRVTIATMNPTRNTYMGTYFFAAAKESSAWKMRCWMDL